MSQQTDTTPTRIIVVLEENNGEIHGTESLALLLGQNNKHWVVLAARRLADSGMITICPSCGGRGRKTSYKRNRNQPGIPSLHRGAQ